MSELAEKVKRSIERIQHFDPQMFSDSNSYYLAFSGGKDSCVCKRLMDMAGVKYDAHYRVTSVDPPELVRFIKDQHPDVHCEVPHYEGERGEELEWDEYCDEWDMMHPAVYREEGEEDG